MKRFVDLNADLGESFGPYTLGMDEAVLEVITSANVACGFHASDPRVMKKTVLLAKEKGVAIGAHPGFPDRVGFGRRVMDVTPEEAETDVMYQIGALKAFCDAYGVNLQHVKPHGALYNHANKNAELSQAIAEGIRAVDPGLILFAQPGSELAKAGERAGLQVAFEVFGDRAYNPDGSLVSRRLPGAVIHDPEKAAAQVVRMVLESRVTAVDGSDVEVPADTICVHGDNPEAIELVRTIRRRLEEGGVAVQSFLKARQEESA